MQVSSERGMAQAEVGNGAAVVQWNHARFGVQGVSKRTGSNPVQGPSVGWSSSFGETVSYRWGKPVSSLLSIPLACVPKHCSIVSTELQIPGAESKKQIVVYFGTNNLHTNLPLT
ncbi:hypothetical protein E2C01_047207 [Portunus trituberculatus]|uniref:Uncharacterized protein n=1 Tax=Portunus trituberculatus TaxID=210409 RepID=A0A5B7G869_PORTR|nr:hypothetical protein [Portunus trituberculatus]